MTNSITIEIEGVGPILFERSKRAKRISIFVKPFKGTRVAVPYGLSFKQAAQFTRTKSNWIKTHLEKVKQYEKQGYLNSHFMSDMEKIEVKTLLTSRLKDLAEKHGFSYNRVFIRNQKTRWGSCSSKNNISLNMKLVRLPDELIDYVILHELVHTQKKDHSKAFWIKMDRLVGDGKKMALRLRKFSLILFQ